ncbi:MAG: DEAD/DEAH box helicase, partial [Lentisphaeria bacterium]
GKTLAFLLPLLNYLYTHRYRSKPKHIRALILAPTRELAKQILKNIEIYSANTKLRYFGVMPGNDIGVQKHETSRGIDIVVATPGRLLTLTRKGHIKLDELETVIVDEADLMLEMGFIRDIEELMFPLPETCQRVMCSATFNPKTALLADELLHFPVKLGMAIDARLADGIEQVFLETEPRFKPSLTAKIIVEQNIRRGIIFVETQKTADRLLEFLLNLKINVKTLHGGLDRKQREQAVIDLSEGKTEILIATDVASRGLHIDYVTHIINYSLPRDPETYIHRLGRSARGKAKGFAVSLCTVEEKDRRKAVEQLLKQKIRTISVNPDDARYMPELNFSDGKRAPKKSVN